MIKIFFATFFLAELIVVIAVISKIYQFNRYVNKYNSMILEHREKVRVDLSNLRLFLVDFSTCLIRIKELIQEKRQEYSLKVLKTAIIYGSIFFLKGKYKKTVLAYQLAKEICEGFFET